MNPHAMETRCNVHPLDIRYHAVGQSQCMHYAYCIPHKRPNFLKPKQLTTFRDFRWWDNDFAVVSSVLAIVCRQVPGNSGRCIIL